MTGWNTSLRNRAQAKGDTDFEGSDGARDSYDVMIRHERLLILDEQKDEGTVSVRRRLWL